MSFFSVGADRQRNATNRFQAEKQLEHSCMECCRRNFSRECDYCEINVAYIEKLNELEDRRARFSVAK